MSVAHTALDAAISEIDRVKAFIKKNGARQVTAAEQLSLIKATCLAWFNNHRGIILTAVKEADFALIDAGFRLVLSSTDKATSKTKYAGYFKTLRGMLSSLRGLTVVAKPAIPSATIDTPPDFSSLVSDPAMQTILAQRWIECTTCVNAGAPLAATVMMGGLLESLLLARVLKEPDRAKLFALTAAPKDPKTLKAWSLQEWSLRHYIDVAREMKWITESVKDVSEVLRDYRNYIHPNKQLSHGAVVENSDAKMFWELSKMISREIL